MAGSDDMEAAAKDLFAYTILLRDKHFLPKKDAKALVYRKSQAIGLDGSPRVKKTFEEAWDTKKRSFNLTDYGNAERLVSDHGDKIIYCHEQGQWYVWDGMRWKKDDRKLLVN